MANKNLNILTWKLWNLAHFSIVSLQQNKKLLHEYKIIEKRII